ncbi:MAG: AbrB/MazE/SpoVT family DNA-binding domain-containing protein [Dehalococcoidia bacterium]
MKVIVDAKGQITIPKRIRDRMGICPGQVMEVEDIEGKFVAVKVMANDPVASVYGILKTDKRTDEIMDELRGPAEL